MTAQETQMMICSIMRFVESLPFQKSPLVLRYIEENCPCENTDIYEDIVQEFGKTHYTIYEIVEFVFEREGIYLEWRGKGKRKYGIDSEFGAVMVRVK